VALPISQRFIQGKFYLQNDEEILVPKDTDDNDFILSDNECDYHNKNISNQTDIKRDLILSDDESEIDLKKPSNQTDIKKDLILSDDESEADLKKPSKTPSAKRRPAKAKKIPAATAKKTPAPKAKKTAVVTEGDRKSGRIKQNIISKEMSKALQQEIEQKERAEKTKKDAETKTKRKEKEVAIKKEERKAYMKLYRLSHSISNSEKDRSGKSVSALQIDSEEKKSLVDYAYDGSMETFSTHSGHANLYKGNYKYY
jgi:hypothetical protein